MKQKIIDKETESSNKQKSNLITSYEGLPSLDEWNNLLITKVLKRAKGNQSAAVNMPAATRQCEKGHFKSKVDPRQLIDNKLRKGH